MYYTEYATAAITHYKSCKYMYDCCVANSSGNTGAQSDFLYRLYYLCGHIVECASIYLIYDHFHYEDNPDDDDWGKLRFHHLHKTYNLSFTQESHIDFYQVEVDQEGGAIELKRKNVRNSLRCSSVDVSRAFFCVQNHKFQDYVKGIIWVDLPQDAPYLRQDSPEDAEYKDAICLLHNWTTDLRYYYEGRKSGTFFRLGSGNAKQPRVDVETISNLLRLCKRIIDLLPAGRPI